MAAKISTYPPRGRWSNDMRETYGFGGGYAEKILFIAKHGWEKYVDEMRKSIRNVKLEGRTDKTGKRDST